MPGADSYPEGSQALVFDSPQRSLVKINSSIAAGGGGGGGGGTQWVYSGNYGGTTPGFTPAGAQAIAFDTSNDAEWHYYGGAWN